MSGSLNDRNFDYVIGKVPRVGAEGQDVTSYLLAAGGYRRDDGTLAAMAYDLRFVQSEPTQRQAPRAGSAGGGETFTQGAAVGLIVAAFVGGIVVAPQVRRWWSDRFAPFLRSRARQAQAGVRAEEVTADVDTEAATAVERDAAAAFSEAVDVAVRDSSVVMGRAEAERRLALLLTAAAIVAEQLRALRQAPFIDQEIDPEFHRAMATLSGEKVIAAINRAAVSPDSQLDGPLESDLLRLFGGGAHVDGAFVPLRSDRVTDALALPDADDDDGEESVRR